MLYFVFNKPNLMMGLQFNSITGIVEEIYFYSLDLIFAVNLPTDSCIFSRKKEENTETRGFTMSNWKSPRCLLNNHK